jgi:prepilin-type N-terminal cleavage/methylation domain-containing protein
MTESRRHTGPRDQDGISLIELMVVLVIVGVGILALSAVQTRSSTDVYSTGRQTRALQLAQTRMELARGAGFALAQSDSGSADGFQWQSVVDSAGIGLRRVRISVTWSDHGRPTAIELDNLLAQR